MDCRPIGIFDSGLGGLTVLDKCMQIMPNEDYIYFGDNARVPYGSKSPETILAYSRQIVSFLISQNVKLIIIACGTASAIAYESLIKEFSIPILNVITPTAKAIADSSIGVIATKATIASHAWENAILKYHPQCHIFSKACPLFVPIVEEGLQNSQIAKEAIAMYLSDYRTNAKEKISSLILGCTHYPILEKQIQAYLSPSIRTIQIGEYVAKEAKTFLEQHERVNLSRKMPERIAYTTDNPQAFQNTYKTFCSFSFHSVQKVTLENN